MPPEKRFLISLSALASWVVLLVTGLLIPASAEPVRNGNEVALLYSTNTPAVRRRIEQVVTGRTLTFRYLEVTDIKKDTPTPGAVTISAR